MLSPIEHTNQFEMNRNIVHWIRLTKEKVENAIARIEVVPLYQNHLYCCIACE